MQNWKEITRGDAFLQGGVVYKDEFICGCCGRAFSLKSKHFIKKLYVYKDWIDISDEITGQTADYFVTKLNIKERKGL